MNVELTRKNKAFHFEGKDSEGRIVNMDCSPEIGGEGKGTRPMELLLLAAGGCVSVDMGLILKKQRQKLDDYSVEVSGERADPPSKEFTSIHFRFHLWGKIDTDKLESAIQLSTSKYCSVLLSLDPEIRITYDYRINEAK